MCRRMMNFEFFFFCMNQILILLILSADYNCRFLIWVSKCLPCLKHSQLGVKSVCPEGFRSEGKASLWGKWKVLSRCQMWLSKEKLQECVMALNKTYSRKNKGGYPRRPVCPGLLGLLISTEWWLLSHFWIVLWFWCLLEGDDSQLLYSS